MRRQLLPALVAMVIFTVILGVVYPLVVTGIAQTAFGYKANGSIISRSGTSVGSSLIGQSFARSDGTPIREYFQSRPSAALGADGKTKNGYDPTLSGGSNYGPTNPKFLKLVSDRVKAYRALNGLSAHTPVPVDAVTASASGLDPDISVANARLQAARVARARGMRTRAALELIDEHTTGRTLGILGENAVNVLELNLALDQINRSNS
jgi:potassium-transporting ATPase KdpC subunit